MGRSSRPWPAASTAGRPAETPWDATVRPEAYNWRMQGRTTLHHYTGRRRLATGHSWRAAADSAGWPSRRPTNIPQRAARDSRDEDWNINPPVTGMWRSSVGHADARPARCGLIPGPVAGGFGLLSLPTRRASGATGPLTQTPASRCRNEHRVVSVSPAHFDAGTVARQTATAGPNRHL